MKLLKRESDRAYLDTWLWVPKKFVSVDGMKSALSFLFTDRYTGEQQVLALYKETPNHLLVPRAFWDPTTLPYETIDCRPRSYAYVPFVSRVRLDHQPGILDGKRCLVPTGDNVQRLSVQAMNDAMGGVLQLACGKGKTVIALELIARGKVPAIVLVDNTNLLEQWIRDVEEFLDVPGGIGIMASGKNDWKKGVVLATYHTIANRADDMPEEVRRWFGQIFWDEAHHVNAPTFSKSADLFYGKRYALTATPERDDGLHIICDYHIGPVLHRDLIQTLKADIIFKWTGMQLDLTDQAVSNAVLDVNGEVSLPRVASYFGRWRDRLWMVMQDAIDAVSAGRKVLVLSNSVDEVVNLMAMWTRGPHTSLYTDIPVPTPADVGESIEALSLSSIQVKKLKRDLTQLWKMAKDQKNWPKLHKAEQQINNMMQAWQHHVVATRVANELKKRQRAFLKRLIGESSTAGLMTYGVPPKTRQNFLDLRQVVFAITKYGREGMDCPDLDTVLVSTPFSSKNNLQQLMGRPTRHKPGKKAPMVVIYEDNIGHCIGMCQKLKKHLRNWSVEEGGPFGFTLLGHPTATACKTSTLKEAFGPSSP